MKFLKCFLFLLLITGLPFQVSAGDVKTAIIMVNDDSGVVTDLHQFTVLRNDFLIQAKNLRRSRKYAQAKLEIISTSLARSVWVGTISDLNSPRDQEVINVTANHKDRCNQLAESFEAVRASIGQLTQQGYDDIHLFFFSSMIATPTPCTDVKIVLPQLPVPVHFLDTLGSSPSIRTIAFYGMNPHQHRVYQEAMQPLSTWANSGGVAFAMFNLVSTTHELKSSLWGIKR